MMLTIKEFDTVLLKDGRKGTVVEIYDILGCPRGYEVEITGTKMELVTVNDDDIKEIL